jgi:hypothetical protein
VQAPSNAPAATEFELLEQFTTIVPDTVIIADRFSGNAKPCCHLHVLT